MKNKIPDNVISYHHSFSVKPEEIDELNHVNNVVYLQWVNDIAAKHWKKLSDKEIDKKYFWVAIRHEIDYLQSAVLGDEITVYTWVGKTGGVKSIRHVYIYKGEILLAKAKTTWCLMSAKSQKPVRITDEIMDVLK